MKKTIISLVLFSFMASIFSNVDYTRAQSYENNDQLLATIESEMLGDASNSLAEPASQKLIIKEKNGQKIIFIRRGIITEVGHNYVKISILNFNYQFNTNNKTVIIRKFGGLSNLNEFTAGDVINAMGILKECPFLIEGKKIRNFSIQHMQPIRGRIDNIFAPNQLDVKNENNQIKTVVVKNSTRIIKNDGSDGKFSDLVKNQFVTVSGIVNTRLSQILAEKIKIRCVYKMVNGRSLCQQTN